ncbi:MULTISPECIES: hypothetical protein [unclassified Ensifer]|uniref:DUF6894 family protein n=1 Tax=unclassified Ensifer TaxID=2633371 RepID=UPI000812FE72|nr:MULTISPECIES: hypothetical protein [unclassified Ensifer]OCP18337.1 hypothetical protein BC361_06660 [Ensifer sp. LC54]OCP27490.1 hypothetical protein BC363_13370 [Ensifer sp. LC384]
MQRYLFHIHLADDTSRDKVGTLLADDSQAVEHGRQVADEIAEEDEYRGVIVAVENAEGRLLARLTASRAMPPWLIARSKFEHAWAGLSIDFSKL